MDYESYKNFLLSSIQGSRVVAGGREILCRCRYCPDSTDPSHAHFYIKLPRNDSELSLFNCYKCGSSGFVSNKVLLEWGIYDPSMAMFITDHNRKVFNNPNINVNMYQQGKIYNLRYNKISDDNLSRYKLNYINNRLGTNLTYEDCIRMKIVLNIKDLLSQNNLKHTRDPRIMNDLDTYFLGFLSVDNAFINLRKLTSKKLYNSINKRYVFYNIHDIIDNTQRFYVIPNSNIDISKPVKLHIGEGPFDAMGIYNIRQETDNNIYGAIGGKAYKSILKYFIINLRIPFMEIHYYPDDEIDQQILFGIADTIRPFGFPFYIHRNGIGKDFGVSKDKIKEILFEV